MYRPTFSMGVIFWPMYVPSGFFRQKPSRFCALWNVRMLAAAVSIAAFSSAGMDASAASISASVTCRAVSFAPSNFSA